MTPLPGDQHWPPDPHLYNPNVFLPFLALNIREESGQSQRFSRSLASPSHNASNPSGSKETPRWSAQTQQSPSFRPQRMCGDVPWPGSAKPTLPTYQGAKLPRKPFSLSILVMEWSVFHNKAYKPGKMCHHELGHISSLPVSIPSQWGKEQRLPGWRVLLSAPLDFVPQKTLVCGRNTENYNKGAGGTAAGVARALCTRWPLHYASWAEILLRGKPASLLVFSSVSSEALLCWRTIQRVRAAFGVELNCITPVLSHVCACLHKRGAWSCGFKSNQQLILKDYCFIVSILRSQIKNPQTFTQVNELSAKPTISATKKKL